MCLGRTVAGGAAGNMLPLDTHNPWIVSVDGARRRLSGRLALGIGLALPLLCAAGGVVSAQQPAVAAWLSSLGGGRVLQAAAAEALLVAAVIGPLLLAGIALCFFVEGRAKRTGNWAPGWAALLGAGAGVAVFGAAFGMLQMSGTLASGLFAGATVSGLVASAAVTLVQVSGEELFFRGWLQPVLCARWGAWVGLGATAALFSFAHAIATTEPLAYMNIALSGLLLGLLALRTGGLAAPIAAHFVLNWSEWSLVGADPNPGVSDLGSVFDFELSGRPLWSGGADGLNGSLAYGLALSCAVATLVLWGAARVRLPAPAAGHRSGPVP